MHRSISGLLLSLSLVAVAMTPAGASASGSSKATPVAASAVAGRAKVLLKLGAMKADPELSRLLVGLSAASRQALGGLPGVRLLEEGEDADAADSKRKTPIVLITGKLLEVEQRPEGEEVVVTAKVEYFVHRMPGQSIAAVVSGTAKTKVAKIQVTKRRLREKLENDLVAAAVESAVRRSAPALKAAAD